MPATPQRLFSTPVGAALFAGALAAAFWFLPWLLDVDSYDQFWTFAFFDVACSLATCSGRMIQDRSLKWLRPTAIGAGLMSLFNLSLPAADHFGLPFPWMVFGFEPVSQACITLIVGALAGWTIARLYEVSFGRCIAMGVLGQLVFLIIPFLNTIPDADEKMSSEVFAFCILALLLGNISAAVLPTLAAEREMRKRMSLAPESSSPGPAAERQQPLN